MINEHKKYIYCMSLLPIIHVVFLFSENLPFSETGLLIYIRILFVMFFDPLYLIMVNVVFMRKTNIDNILRRYVIACVVLIVNCILNCFAINLNGGNILDCLVNDASGLMIVYLFTSVSFIILSIGWLSIILIRVFVKYVIRKHINTGRNLGD